MSLPLISLFLQKWFLRSDTHFSLACFYLNVWERERETNMRAQMNDTQKTKPASNISPAEYQAAVNTTHFSQVLITLYLDTPRKN